MRLTKQGVRDLTVTRFSKPIEVTASDLAQHERNRIAEILERELLEEERHPSRTAAELAYRKGYNDRTRSIVRRLRTREGCDSLCS